MPCSLSLSPMLAAASLVSQPNFEGLMMAFKRIPLEVDPDALMERTFALP